jgi:hypothetical protein
MDIMANVTMSGEMPLFTIMIPLQNPIRRARRMTNTTTGRTMDSRPRIRPVVKQVVKLITDPTDKSIPAVRSTRVCPMLTIPRATA